MINLAFLLNALVVAIVVAVVAYIADFFLAKGDLGFPRQIVWLIAFVVWLLVVFGGGTPLLR